MDLLRVLAPISFLLAVSSVQAGLRPTMLGAESPETFPLASAAGVAALRVDDGDWPGVMRAAGDLQQDLFAVTGTKPSLLHGESAQPVEVIIGTLGRNGLIDRLAREGKIDVDVIAHQWEAYLVQTVDAPLPGVRKALVIAGSDKRGTIYGLYELSQQIGVSPWHWWCDLAPLHHDNLAVTPGRWVFASPAVRYRGIFLNDEAPDLTNWIRAKYGDVPVGTNPPLPRGVANYGHEFYARIFEVLLRLRGNYLWPAMWNNAFNEDDPENARLADEYGIVMGTSHQEPMLRAQKEWDRRYEATLGHWNYAKTPDVLEAFWRDGIRRNRDFESIVTLGLRGANDTEMAPGGPAANRALLEHIVDRQRLILHEELTGSSARMEQMWCLYKEVQDYYEAGMRVPDDITMLWADDNWGDLRRVPSAAERGRPGGAGIYYHFDYHGSPRNYQWINTSPLPKIWEQMSLAHRYGADRIWIANVGHFKGYELPLEFFLDLAWEPARWTGDNLDSFARDWAAREFGPELAGEIGSLLNAYPKLTALRKPELLAPDTFSLVNYGEAERVAAAAADLARRADAVAVKLPHNRRDAFYQLVQFPCRAFSNVCQLHLAAGRNALYAAQGRASAGDYAVETKRWFQADADLMAQYNGSFADGRWAHFMDQTHLGYTTWRDPPENSLNGIALVTPGVPEGAALGVAVDGSTASWPGPASNLNPVLPWPDSLNRQRTYIDVFNRGQTAFDFTVKASVPWIKLSAAAGHVGPDHRIWVDVDWEHMPLGEPAVDIVVAGAGASVTVRMYPFHPGELTRESLNGYVEGNGYVSIAPEHFTRKIDAGDRQWQPIADYGRAASAFQTTGPVDAPAATPGKDSPCLEYRFVIFRRTNATIDVTTSSSLNIAPDRGLRYAISIDDDPPQVVTLIAAGYRAQNGNHDWEKSVSENARHGLTGHHLGKVGSHVLKLWMVDPGIVVQKIVIDTGGLRPSYLGPPETFCGGAK